MQWLTGVTDTMRAALSTLAMTAPAAASTSHTASLTQAALAPGALQALAQLAAVLDVIEAVNYLTSAGGCFVIFGKEGAEDAALTRHRACADDYLQKLVNIEIRVPPPQGALAGQYDGDEEAVDWPPGVEEQQVFTRLPSGVRLSGDPQIIRPVSRVSTRAKDRKSK